MNVQLESVLTRQFWAGVAATIVAGALVAIGVPNLLRAPGSAYEAQHGAYLEDVRGLAPAMKASLSLEEKDRKTIRNGAMDLIVKSPKDASEKIRQQQLGGFLVSSETSGGEDASSASLTIRIPADRFEEARTEIRKLGLRVESEKLNAQMSPSNTWTRPHACATYARRRRSISES